MVSSAGLVQILLLNRVDFISSYTTLWGTPEKYIRAAHSTGVGWEINFIPQGTYGEFEQMNDWFRDELKHLGRRFEAMGHQWVVFPNSDAIKDSHLINQLK